MTCHAAGSDSELQAIDPMTVLVRGAGMTPPEHPLDRMRIVYVINTLHIGGAERQLSRLIGEFVRLERWDISVYCLERRGPFIEAITDIGVEVHGLDKPWSSSPVRVFRSFLSLYSFLRRERPTIVHCYLPVASVLGALAAHLAGVPYIVQSRSGMIQERGWRRICWCRALALADRWSAAVIAVSKAVLQEAIREGTPATKARVIYNSVKVPNYIHGDRRRVEGTPILGSVGRLSPEKGHRFLIEALASVLTVVPAARLVLVGDGPERSALEQLAIQLGVAERVDFMGYRTDVLDLLPSFDLFVLPSLTEAMPNALLEAMAAGVPVVATRVDGIPEIIQHEVNGWLVSPASADDLARTLVRLAQDEPLRAALGQRGHATVAARFSVEQEVAQTEDVYVRLLGQRPSAPS
jgi:glycosyltransferase involved in cell wall biosynthesis